MNKMQKLYFLYKKTGQETDLVALYNETLRYLTAYIKTNYKFNDYDIEELQGEWYFTFKKAIEQYDESTLFSNYIYHFFHNFVFDVLSIIKNVSLYMSSKYNISVGSIVEGNMWSEPTHFIDPFEKKENSIILENLFIQKILNKNKKKVYKVMCMLFLEDKTVKEIATVLKCTTQNVYVQKKIGLKFLDVELEKEKKKRPQKKYRYKKNFVSH